MTTVEITERASEDLLSLVDFLSATSREAAYDFIDKLEIALERLRSFPESGAPHGLSSHGGERVVFVRPARVIYRFEHGVVSVLRVIHHRRDISRLSLD